MQLHDVVLFLHILTLLVAIGLGSTLHHAEWSTRKAGTVAELRTITGVYKHGRLFPFLLILLLAEGMWLLQLSKSSSVSDPWVWTAVVAVAILMVSGGAVLGPHSAKYAKLLAATPDGPITPELRAATFAPSTWGVSHMNTALAVAVVFNMVTKPSDALPAVAVLVLGVVVGTAIGLVGVRAGQTVA